MQRLKPDGVEEREVSEGRYTLIAQACETIRARLQEEHMLKKRDSTNRGTIGVETKKTTILENSWESADQHWHRCPPLCLHS